MFEDYCEKQSFFYNYILTSFKNNKLFHAYLIETNGVSYATDLVINMAKFFLCKNSLKCDNCDICKNFNIDNYPDIKIIETDNKVIKKEQLLDLQKAFSVKPVYGKYLIYIIKDASLLNGASANAILKFLEEPNDNIIAILLVDNIYKVINTIVSRCQVLSLVPENNNLNKIVADFIMKNQLDDANVSEKIKEIINFYQKIESKQTKILLDSDVYKFKDMIGLFLNVGMYLYSDVLNYLLGRKMENFNETDDDIIYFIKNNKINDIIWKIDLINNFIEKSKFNINRELFIDNFIISMGGKKYD